MRNVTLLSAALIAAATFATPVLAAGNTSRHVGTRDNTHVVSTMRSDEGDGCVRAPRVGAYATAPWTDAAPCEPNTAY